MADEKDFPFTEPIPLPDTSCSGFNVEVDGKIVRLIGWTYIPAPEPQRRMVARIVMPEHVAIELADELAKAIKRRQPAADSRRRAI
jgi:hypothetical protein